MIQEDNKCEKCLFFNNNKCIKKLNYNDCNNFVLSQENKVIKYPKETLSELSDNIEDKIFKFTYEIKEKLCNNTNNILLLQHKVDKIEEEQLIFNKKIRIQTIISKFKIVFIIITLMLSLITMLETGVSLGVLHVLIELIHFI